MTLAGQVKLLSAEQMQTVHEKALQLLAEKGIVFEADDCVEILRRGGARVEGNTVFINSKLVEKCLATTPARFVLEAPDPARNVTIGEGLLIHPAGGEIFVLDHDGRRRGATLSDFSDLQKLYQACANVDIAGYQPISPQDLPERSKGLRCTLESLRASNKPILAPMELETVEKKLEVLRLMDLAFGGNGAGIPGGTAGAGGGGRAGDGSSATGTGPGAGSYLAEHYVTWHIVCPNSPFFYSQFACDGIRVFAEYNQPVCIVSAPMSGITAPVFLLSTLVLTLAEELAGLVLAQLIRPGVPVVLSSSLTDGYMRTATWECASPDTALMLAASTQMIREFYGLPARSQTGVTSSKTIDYQAGIETMQSFLYCALAGTNLTSQTVGSLANLLTVSLEKTVLDDEAVGRVRHMLSGMPFSDEQLGMDDLLGAEPATSFLEADSTMEHFREYWA
ncbi:MAG: trimethylamine methyltransferase family protein, partial [Coriobacteriales bacterium]|nr:trimethylamine methyltransferase family protein [Coriobacteriales bacterium]